MFNVQDAINSPTFKNAMGQAQDYISHPNKIQELINKVQGKLSHLERQGGPIGELIEKFSALPRMAKAYVAGDYKKVPLQSLLSGVGAMVYLTMENDLIDDATPWIGYLDDAGVIAFALKVIAGDIDEFIAWEATQQGANA
jgi:uncharacterized membrane protein YkvA (DUF1232 family)